MFAWIVLLFWIHSANAVPSLKNVAYQTGPSSQKLDLFFPTTPPPYKTVLMIHGGCFIWGSKDATDNLEYVRRLLNLGYAVASVNYRLAVPNFNDPQKGVNLYPAALEDVEDAFCWLKENAQKYHLAKDKIGAMGYSAGGTLAAYLGTAHSAGIKRTPRCNVHPSLIVDFFGRTNFLKTTENPTHADGFDCGEHFVGLSRDDTNPQQEFRDADVLTHTDSHTAAPSLLLHGGADHSVSVENSFRFCKKLGDKCEIKILPGTDHMFTNPDDMDKAFAEVARFLKARLDSQSFTVGL